MAKKMRKLFALCMALVLVVSVMTVPAFAKGHGRPGGGNSDGYEWYQVIVNGSVAASGQGPNGDVGWLVRGVYSYGVSMSGTIMNWRAGNQSGAVNVANYISIPEGFEIAEGGYTVTSHSVSGTNSQAAQYDNAIITVNITALFNPTTGETLPVETEPEVTEPEVTEPEVTEPEATETEAPTEPDPVQTSVTVNHLYYTYDIYTGETVQDGETSASEATIENQSYTATAVTAYNGNAYEQLSVSPAMSITIAADAAANVISISYMRTIDTTPAPAQTSVTVNHLYYTYDIYTGETVQDGETSASEEVVEGQTYDATAVTSYDGNVYEPLSVSPAMSITIAADAVKNVIDISYMRTIDTTPVEPDPTEPPATEPPATEPPATEPPATEPPATEPPATEPPATEPPATEPPATEPPATEPPVTERPVPPVPAVINEEIDIFDEDVPLADAPKTGDISALWIAVSGICAAGMIVLGKKREDEEE